MRLLDAVKSSTEYLEEAGIEDAFVDAELLTLHAAGIDRLAAYMENPEIDRMLSARIRRLVRRRAAGEPVQYITGSVDFMGLEIKVGKGVLIPRPETELLAQEAAEEIRSRGGAAQPFRILDLCTGSGCLAVFLAREFPHAEVYASDVSKAALGYAGKNALVNGVRNVRLLEGSLFEPLGDILFDLIVSNPPYIKKSDIPGLQREIREWEPVNALDGGPDGLDFYRLILAGAVVHLEKGGTVILELGFGQADDVRKIAKRSGFSRINVMKDFSGIERILKTSVS